MIAWCFAALALVVALVLGLRLRARTEARDALSRELAAHAERERMLQAVVESSPLAVLLYEDAGRIVYANEAARQLFFMGVSPEGQNFLRLVADAPEALRAVLLGTQDEITSFDVDGQHETYHVSRRTFELEGNLHTLLSVRHLTREVARHELDVLKKVVRLVSHEVNNSLAPISSLVHSSRQILKSGERLERLDRVLDTIEERTKHLAGFIAGYAALARLPRPVPREQPWGELTKRLAAMYPSARFDVPDGARGWFDAAQIEQALINVLKNAFEAGAAEGVALEITPHHALGATLRVLDRGKGFSADSLSNALLPFYTTKPSGSGMGLVLVREIVDAHGGKLSLGPREGGGACVTLELPGKAGFDAVSRARLTLTRG